MNKSKRTDRDSLVKKAAYLRLMAIKLTEDMKSGTFKSLYNIFLNIYKNNRFNGIIFNMYYYF